MRGSRHVPLISCLTAWRDAAYARNADRCGDATRSHSPSAEESGLRVAQRIAPEQRQMLPGGATTGPDRYIFDVV